MTAQAKDKENEAPCGNSSEDATKTCSPEVDKTRIAHFGNGSSIKASCSPVTKSNATHETANKYAGNTWEKYYMATVEEPLSSRENLSGAGKPLGGDKYSAIALLDDDQEDEKWSERTAVITALDHQVSDKM